VACSRVGKPSDLFVSYQKEKQKILYIQKRFNNEDTAKNQNCKYVHLWPEKISAVILPGTTDKDNDLQDLYIRPVLLYGSETWLLTKREEI
jgi:hypothetical protein